MGPEVMYGDEGGSSRFIQLPIVEPHGAGWGAVEHHDEWSCEVEYTSLVGTPYRTTWDPSALLWTVEVIDG